LRQTFRTLNIIQTFGKIQSLLESAYDILVENNNYISVGSFGFVGKTLEIEHFYVVFHVKKR